MSPLIRRLAFGLYILAAIILFGYYLFPADTIRNYIISQSGQLFPGSRLAIDGVGPRLPYTLQLSAVDLYHRDTLLLAADQFALKPAITSLFSNTKAFTYAGQLHNGQVDGEITLPPETQSAAFNLKSALKDIDLTTIPALEPWREQIASGTLEGRIRYDQRNNQPNMGGQITFRDVMVKLDLPIEQLDHLAFTAVTADIQRTGAKVEIRQCQFSGNQGEGQVTGVITLGTPLGASTLNLSGRFRPNPGLIMQLQGSIWGEMLTGRGNQAQTGFPFRVRGRLADPQWQLR